MKTVGLTLIVSALLAACASSPSAPSVSANMAGRSGATVSGTVAFSDVAGGVRVTAQVAGLTPGEHGFHIHEVGDCSAPDASSAKGHFNPAGKTHGHHGHDERHGGDMPNLLANAQGEARLTADLKGVSVSQISGRSVVIHADPDDYKSQPAGNSGKRVACGVIAAR